MEGKRGWAAQPRRTLDALSSWQTACQLVLNLAIPPILAANQPVSFPVSRHLFVPKIFSRTSTSSRQRSLGRGGALEFSLELPAQGEKESGAGQPNQPTPWTPFARGKLHAWRVPPAHFQTKQATIAGGRQKKSGRVQGFFRTPEFPPLGPGAAAPAVVSRPTNSCARWRLAEGIRTRVNTREHKALNATRKKSKNATSTRINNATRNCTTRDAPQQRNAP